MAVPTPLRTPDENLARLVQRGLTGTAARHGTAPVRPIVDRSK